MRIARIFTLALVSFFISAADAHSQNGTIPSLDYIKKGTNGWSAEYVGGRRLATSRLTNFRRQIMVGEAEELISFDYVISPILGSFPPFHYKWRWTSIAEEIRATLSGADINLEFERASVVSSDLSETVNIDQINPYRDVYYVEVQCIKAECINFYLEKTSGIIPPSAHNRYQKDADLGGLGDYLNSEEVSSTKNSSGWYISGQVNAERFADGLRKMLISD